MGVFNTSRVLLFYLSITASLLVFSKAQFGLLTSESITTGVANPLKIKIESFQSVNATTWDFCMVYADSNNYPHSKLWRYNMEMNTSDVSFLITNPPFNNVTVVNVDVADGINECRISTLTNTEYYVSGTTPIVIGNTGGEAYSISKVDSQFIAVIRQNNSKINGIAKNFTGEVQSKRLSETSALFAVPLESGGIYVGKYDVSLGPTPIYEHPSASQVSSFSVAVFNSSNYAVCFILQNSLLCWFTGRPGSIPLDFQPLSPEAISISFLDCNRLVIVGADSNQYAVKLFNILTNSFSTGAADIYLSSPVALLTNINHASSSDIISIVSSNSTGIYLDVLKYSNNLQECGMLPPTTPVYQPITMNPTTVPEFVPVISPEASPESQPLPQAPSPNGPSIEPDDQPGTNTLPPLFTPTAMPLGSLAPTMSPEGINPVSLGVGLSVPLAVIAAGVFLLVFLLRRRNKKKRQIVARTTNSLKDFEGPESGKNKWNLGDVTLSIPKYTSIGLKDMNADTYASASAILPDIDKRLHIYHNSLKFIREIGAGSYGKVFLGEWRGAKVAIKVNNQITDVEGFLAEAKLTLGIAPHPNLVQTFGVSLDGTNPCIVLEYCGGGSLDSILFDAKKPLPISKQREYTLNIAYGLVHLHKNSIVHRDLAARNILLTSEGQPKISDFGMSRLIRDEGAKGQTKTTFGPIRWMAPESLRDRSYSTKSDVWTFGIVVNEIISRKEPHFDEDQLNIAVKIRDQATTPVIPDDGDPVLIEVIHKCLKANPNDRPTMEEICHSLRSKIETEED